MKNSLNLKYNPKFFGSLCFFILLILAVILFWGRRKPSFRIDFILNFLPDFYQNISNFSIAYLIYSGIGFIWLLKGVDFKYIAGLGAALLLINFIWEKWISILNTPDIIDAYYGFAGIFLSFLFLFFTKQFGLELNKTEVK